MRNKAYLSPFCFSATQLKLKDVQNELKEVTEWYQLGIQLEVPVDKLCTIESNHSRDADRCKTEALIWWLHNIEDTSWGKLAKAVEAVGHSVLAKKLREKPQGELIFLDCVLLY